MLERKPIDKLVRERLYKMDRLISRSRENQILNKPMEYKLYSLGEGLDILEHELCGKLSDFISDET